MKIDTPVAGQFGINRHPQNGLWADMKIFASALRLVKGALASSQIPAGDAAHLRWEFLSQNSYRLMQPIVAGVSISPRVPVGNAADL